MTVRRGSDAVTGILCLVAGVAVYAIQDVVMKLLSGGYPVHQVLAIRSLTAIPFFVALAWMTGGFRQFRDGDWRLMMGRGAIQFVAFTCYYLAFAALPLATSVALFFTAPLFITLLTVWMLREPVGVSRWAAVAGGFVGTLIIVRPGSSVFEPAAILPVLAALFYGTSQMVQRRFAGTANALTFAFYGNLSFLLGSVLSAALFGHGALADQAHPSLAFLFRGWVAPPAGDLALMMSCGLVSCAGSLLISQAYRVASPPVVAPLEYTAIVWSATSGWLIWNEIPTGTTLVGIAVIIGAGLYVLWTERRLPR